MSDEKKLSPEARDKLAAKLRANLGGSRPRPWLWALGGMTLTALILWGLWRASQPPPPLPPVMLTVFDALRGDPIEAQLSTPGHPDVKLEGLPVHWKLSGRVFTPQEADSKTDANGVARFPEEVRPDAGPPDLSAPTITIDASYLDPRDKSRRRDARATLHMMGPLLLVAIEDLAPENTNWRETPPDKMPRPALPPDKLVACAVGPVDAETYRAIRAWLHPHLVLRQSIEDLEKRPNMERWRPAAP